MKNRYEKMTANDFDGIFDGIISEMTASEILALPGVYEILSEELNNEVLETWEEQNPETDDESEEDE